MSRLTRRTTYAAIGAVWLAAIAAGALAGLADTFGQPPLGKDLEYSTTVLDRDGKLLRAYLTDEGRWRLPATPADVDPRFIPGSRHRENPRR